MLFKISLHTALEIEVVIDLLSSLFVRNPVEQVQRAESRLKLVRGRDPRRNVGGHLHSGRLRVGDGCKADRNQRGQKEFH